MDQCLRIVFILQVKATTDFQENPLLRVVIGAEHTFVCLCMRSSIYISKGTAVPHRLTVAHPFAALYILFNAAAAAAALP